MLSEDEYQKVLALAKPHIQNLEFITKLFTKTPEGGIFYSHLSFKPEEQYVVKQKNLIYLAKKCERILEIGFNMGHSALFMLLANPKCTIVCLDICSHPYTVQCYKYLSMTFPKRLAMFVGDSNENLEDVHTSLFDMAHVDGCHEFKTAKKDLWLSHYKVKPEGYIVFDDTDLSPMRQIWQEFVKIDKVDELTLIPTEFHKIGIVKVPKLKIAICSLAVGEDYIKKVKYGIERRKIYAALKNYDYYSDTDVFDKDRPCAWSKIPLITRYLNSEKNYDYVVWIDADTHIMNLNIKLEEIIKKFQNGKDILLTLDFGGKINSGVMFIRNSLWSREFFNKLYTKTEFLHSANWEQDAMIDMLEKNEFNCVSHFEILPPEKQHIFNAYHCNYQYNDFIVHLAGCYRYGNNNGLDAMMNTFCPQKMEQDTEESFRKRLNFLKTFRPVRELEI